MSAKWFGKRRQTRADAQSSTRPTPTPGYTVQISKDGTHAIVTSKGSKTVTHRVRVGPSSAKTFATHA